VTSVPGKIAAGAGQKHNQSCDVIVHQPHKDTWYDRRSSS
jgi:hypothetical protein